ncbi:MAG TPA: RES domain-containing protein [Acidobacteriota bacterium]
MKAKNADFAFDGEGARVYGGRWNSPGTAMVYTAESISLAVLEVLVHVSNTTLLPSYVLCGIHFSESDIESFDARALPKNWRAYPAPPELQTIGDEWVKSGRSLSLKVPSSVVPEENIFLLNPAHKAFKSVRIDKPLTFKFDLRLLKL